MKKMFCLILTIVILAAFTGCGCNGDITYPAYPTDATEQQEKITATVYFPDNEVMYLIAEERDVVGSDIVDFAEGIFKEILKGPADEALNDALHGDVKLLSVAVDENGLCTIDLSKEFELYNTGGSAMESMAIYSIVNSLCSLEGIDRVKINIEGDEGAEYGGHFLLDEPFEEDTNFYCVK